MSKGAGCATHMRLVADEEVPHAVPAGDRLGLGARPVEQRVETRAGRAQPLDALAVVALGVLAHDLLARVARGERERQAVARDDHEVLVLERLGRALLGLARDEDALLGDGEPVGGRVLPLVERGARHADERLGLAPEHAQLARDGLQAGGRLTQPHVVAEHRELLLGVDHLLDGLALVLVRHVGLAERVLLGHEPRRPALAVDELVLEPKDEPLGVRRMLVLLLGLVGVGALVGGLLLGARLGQRALHRRRRRLGLGSGHGPLARRLVVGRRPIDGLGDRHRPRLGADGAAAAVARRHELAVVPVVQQRPVGGRARTLGRPHGRGRARARRPRADGRRDVGPVGRGQLEAAALGRAAVVGVARGHGALARDGHARGVDGAHRAVGRALVGRTPIGGLAASVGGRPLGGAARSVTSGRHGSGDRGWSGRGDAGREEAEGALVRPARRSLAVERLAGSSRLLARSQNFPLAYSLFVPTTLGTNKEYVSPGPRASARASPRGGRMFLVCSK